MTDRDYIRCSDLELRIFREAAEKLGYGVGDWQWIGEHMSQRMFNLNEKRAKEYAERYGGVASKMEDK